VIGRFVPAPLFLILIFPQLIYDLFTILPAFV